MVKKSNENQMQISTHTGGWEPSKGKIHNVADTVAHTISQGNPQYLQDLQELWGR